MLLHCSLSIHGDVIYLLISNMVMLMNKVVSKKGLSVKVRKSGFGHGFPSNNCVTLCYILNVCVTQNAYVDTLVPNVMVCGAGAFGR